MSLRCTVHLVAFLFTRIHLLFYCVMCSAVYFVCVRVVGGRTFFHKVPCAPLVRVSKHDTAAWLTHLFPLCSPCTSEVCRMGVVLHLQKASQLLRVTSSPQDQSPSRAVSSSELLTTHLYLRVTLGVSLANKTNPMILSTNIEMNHLLFGVLLLWD